MKKLLPLILAFTLAITGYFYFVGCGEAVIDAPTTTSTAETTTTSTTTTTTATTGTTEASSTTSSTAGETATTTTTTITSTTSSTTTSTAAPQTYSVSGAVNFTTTADGIKGGAAISVSGPISALATADSVTGTYEVRNLPAGTYTFSASKSGWTIASLIITPESITLVGKELFRAYPVSWEVLNVGGMLANASLESIVSTESVSPGTILAAGRNSAGLPVLIKATPPFSSWTEVTVDNITNEGYVYIGEPAGYLLLVDRGLNLFASIEAENFIYFGINTMTTEAIGEFCGPLDTLTFEAVTESGKIIRTIDNAVSMFDITPTSGGLAGMVVRSGRGSAPEAILIAGNGGKWGYSSNGGSSWTDMSSTQFTEDLTAISAHQNGMFVASANGTIFVINGVTSNVELSGVPYPITGFYNRSNASPLAGTLACGGNGLIMRRR